MTPCVTFRQVAVSLRGPGQSPVLSFALGPCFPAAAVAGVPAGVVSALTGPSSWRTAVVLAGGGQFDGFWCPLPSTPSTTCLAAFRCVREAQLLNHSVCCPGRPPPASPHCNVCEAQLLHLSAWCSWALGAPSGFRGVSCAPLWWQGRFTPHRVHAVILGSSHPGFVGGFFPFLTNLKNRAAGVPLVALWVPYPLCAWAFPQDASGGLVVAHWVLDPLGVGKSNGALGPRVGPQGAVFPTHIGISTGRLRGPVVAH